MANLRANLEANLWANNIPYTGTYFWGSWDYIWPYYEGGRRIGLKYNQADSDALDAHIELFKTCGWLYLYNDIAFICDRPSVLNLDERGRLHCTNGAALAFVDGYELYAVSGVRVPEYVVMRSNEITAEKILKESNAEVRRVMIERMGAARFAQAGVAVHQDLDALGQPRRLIKVPMGDGDWYAVEVTDSSLTENSQGEWVRKKYVLSINPDHYNGRAGRECHAAIASTWRYPTDRTKLVFKRPEDYAPLIET